MRRLGSAAAGLMTAAGPPRFFVFVLQALVLVFRREATGDTAGTPVDFYQVFFAGLCFVARREAVHGPIFYLRFLSAYPCHVMWVFGRFHASRARLVV